MRQVVALVLAVLLAVGVAAYVAQAQAPRSRLEVVRARGKLICGVSGTTPGFSFIDPRTNTMRGFDADFCRAVAAFAGVNEVEFVNLTAASRIPAVVSGSVDVVFRTTTQTFGRDEQVDFGPVIFYDGQRLLVRSTSRIRSLNDLNGARICVHTGTTSERNITDQLRLRGFRFELITFAQAAEAFNGLVAGRCDAFTTDASQLAAFRATAPNPRDFMIVGEVFSDEPLAPMYAQNDSAWADTVDWTVYGLILAEELRITQITASSETRLREIAERNPVAKPLIEARGGAMMRAVRLVGNYGEIYNRYFGPAAQIQIPRRGTRNMLARDGGALTSRPFRS